MEQLISIAMVKIEKSEPDYFHDYALLTFYEESEGIASVAMSNKPLTIAGEVDKGNGEAATISEIIIGGGYEVEIEISSGEILEFWAGQ